MRIAALIMLAAIAVAPAACRKQPEGTIKVLVIGNEPKLRDPALGPLTAPDKLLLATTAQGLVRFDAAGNIVAGLAERWTVSPDGLSYIFRLQPATWPDGRKITAEQVVRILKRQIAARSKNDLKDRFGSVEDIVAMTDRVIEISLISPRTDLLALLAQPEMGILRDGKGTGPFTAERSNGAFKLTREIVTVDDEQTTKEQLVLDAADAEDAVRSFAAGKADLVLGGTFVDLPWARGTKLDRNALRFDPASGLFGLVPLAKDGPLANSELRDVLNRAIDRDAFVTALSVPGLTPRATLLEPGLDGVPAPAAPPWTATPLAERLPALQAEAARLSGTGPKRPIRLALPDGPGADMLLGVIQHSWGALGFTVERAASRGNADFALIDEVAPSASPAWFVRYFRCAAARVCNSEIDAMMEAARQSATPAERYALLAQAAGRIDDAQLFMPIAAPVRWSLVSRRIQTFAGNRYARHTLTDLEGKPAGD
ncbi:MAG TPA: ABC transporter substrate-binding protein [Sphingomicrobium sp.]|jgi:peptide/nickel transport system substrate-binding protein